MVCGVIWTCKLLKEFVSQVASDGNWIIFLAFPDVCLRFRRFSWRTTESVDADAVSGSLLSLTSLEVLKYVIG